MTMRQTIPVTPQSVNEQAGGWWLWTGAGTISCLVHVPAHTAAMVYLVCTVGRISLMCLVSLSRLLVVYQQAATSSTYVLVVSHLHQLVM